MKKNNIDNIIDSIDPTIIPAEFVSEGTIQYLDGTTTVMSAKQLAIIMEDEDGIESYGISNIHLVVDREKLKKTIIYLTNKIFQ